MERIKSYCVAPTEDHDEDTVDIGVGGGGIPSGRSNSHSGVCGRASNELTIGVAATEAERRASVASATGGAGGIPRWAEGLHRGRMSEEADIEVKTNHASERMNSRLLFCLRRTQKPRMRMPRAMSHLMCFDAESVHFVSFSGVEEEVSSRKRTARKSASKQHTKSE